MRAARRSLRGVSAQKSERKTRARVRTVPKKTQNVD